MDVPASPKQYVEEIGTVNYICAAFMDLAIVVGVGPSRTHSALADKQVEPIKEATPTLQQSQASGAPAANKEKGVYIPALKKEHVPLT